MSDADKAKFKELSFIAAIIGIIPALAGLGAAFIYVHQFVFPRTEAEDLKGRVTSVEYHQNVQDERHAEDLRRIMDEIVKISRALPRLRETAGAGKGLRDEDFSQVGASVVPLVNVERTRGAVTSQPESTL